MTTAFPLSWPDGFPRSKSRETGQFRTSLAGALNNVRTSLNLFGRDSGKPVTDVVLSSNVSLGCEKPADPGVAVWFRWQGMQVCIPVDRYATPAANLQAIHHVLEARRVELRHGTLALVMASMKGFAALPAPAGRHWSEVLGVSRTAGRDEIEAAHRLLIRQHHPDSGGSEAAAAEINAARDAALKERT
ncbi:hypothetical protein GGR16_002365 [Chelatococcus caeni]|uniref:J domain-containing protein n=1 Tax=Chelatococcus caeni TaxID=1348468 RepID=A0A840C340_9HYPH|nr:J domain-containing protein [Chelatococcus caeni]MBB4017336.1 hypothetical protein [Chelatococcus caeni]